MHRAISRLLAVFGTAILLNAAIAQSADEWPQFRGPDGQGHAGAARVPTRFSDTENVVWKQPIPGRGWSSPVISDGVCW
ncbi:MAG: serine/threonine protein kinase, partial [Planctomycetota bacterium]|nr:serine/threonine protein kinase [Planctomycetota bacterium]